MCDIPEILVLRPLGELDRLHARIEALEAALREIEDCLDYVKDRGVVWKITRAALDRDAGK